MRKKQEDNNQEIETKKADKKDREDNLKTNKLDSTDKAEIKDNNQKGKKNEEKLNGKETENIKKNKAVKEDKVVVKNEKEDNKNNKKIEYKEENIEKVDEIEEKNEEKELEDKEEISKEKLDKIKDEIKRSKSKNKNNPKMQKARKSVLRNILIAIMICIYFLFISLGTKTIPATEYVLDLKTFAIFIVIISIVIFEKAYKKDENYLALHGIEMTVVGILTLVILYFYSISYEYFSYILCSILGLVVVYYIIKSIIILIRNKIKNR